ncbi:MAG: hypothetical protein IBX62_01480 [Coriobacteriia bacterium]|nr:hypothetical protein [Coriobacteriia bacterium]
MLEDDTVPAGPPDQDEGTTEERQERSRFAVLDVFGLKLEVSNPRLAELLTMDAKDALGADVREFVGAAPQVHTGAGTEAVPEVVLSVPRARDEQEARLRREFRARVEADGAAIGFATSGEGMWKSASGLSILTRAIERPVSLAAASHYVSEVANRRETVAGPDSTALFIVDGQQTADVFKVAIRQRRLYDLMRTIAVENLEEIRALVEHGTIDHAQAVVLLVPIANIDVGEVLSIIRSAAPEAEAG